MCEMQRHETPALSPHLSSCATERAKPAVPPLLFFFSFLSPVQMLWVGGGALLHKRIEFLAPAAPNATVATVSEGGERRVDLD